jgi:hypothetical protein
VFQVKGSVQIGTNNCLLWLRMPFPSLRRPLKTAMWNAPTDVAIASVTPTRGGNDQLIEALITGGLRLYREQALPARIGPRIWFGTAATLGSHKQGVLQA